MAEISTVARPYAQAVFGLAKDQKNFPVWSDTLALLSAVASDSTMQAVIRGAHVDREQISSLFVDVCGEHIDDGARNFVRLLAHNARLEVLPQIAAHYEVLRADAERVVEAELETPLPITETQQEKIVESLEKRLGRSVKLSTKTNTALIGGAVIRAGDLVIDGSVRAKLQKLAGTLSV